MNVELLINHENKLFVPAVLEGITWRTERKNYPGTLAFSVIADDNSPITEGDAVRLTVDNNNVFYGFVFTIKHDKNNTVSVTAYDQLRYLKNKDTYVYENKTAGEVVSMIAADFRLKTGDIENTGFKIASRVESDQTLFDIIQNALDLTLQSTKQMFVLFDDFGKLSLKSIKNMRNNIVIDENSAENYDYSSSIDTDTYNKVKLTFDNDDTGTRDVYIAQSGGNINKWGVLQYYDTLKKGENGQAKADALLNLYNSETRGLSIKNAFGDNSIRAGCLVPVMLDLGDVKVKNYMLVEKCKHEFKNNSHFMDLDLRGGEFIA